MAEQQKNQSPAPVVRPGGPGRGGPWNARVMREKPKDVKGTLRKLMKYIGSSKYWLILLLLCVVASTVLTVTGPSLQGKAIDAITIDVEANKLHVDIDALIRALTMMGCVYICSAIMQLCQGLISARISQTTVYTLRKDLFRKISHLPIQYLDTHPHGDVMSRMTNDVDNVSPSSLRRSRRCSHPS